jgi:hypothetical protein
MPTNRLTNTSKHFPLAIHQHGIKQEILGQLFIEIAGDVIKADWKSEPLILRSNRRVASRTRQKQARQRMPLSPYTDG